MEKLSDNRELVDFLSDYDYEIIEIAKKLRKIILSKFEDDIEERIYHNWKGIGYIHKDTGYIVGIFPKNKYVRLGFEHGNMIIDKYKVFEKGGEQVKYIRFKDLKNIDENIINDYLEQSVLLSGRYKR